MYLKDYHRRNLLAGSEEEETPRITMTYEQEQNALKDAFALPNGEDEEEDLIQPKKKSKEDKSQEEQDYRSFLQQSLKDEASKKMLEQLQSLPSQPTPSTLATEEENEAFLMKYLLNRGWLDPSTSMPELYEDASSDEEKAEEFENQYNFRFEQPGGASIVTHARTVSTARRGEEKRKHERERKRTQKEEVKKKEVEEIARLRNLKRMELEERIKRIEEVAGAGGWTEKDLEGDFDPQEWDKKMQGVFNETYYTEVFILSLDWTYIQEDKKRPKFEEIDISDLVEEDVEQAPQIIENRPTKREKIEKKRKIEQYLDEQFPLNVVSYIGICWRLSNRNQASDIERCLPTRLAWPILRCSQPRMRNWTNL